MPRIRSVGPGLVGVGDRGSLGGASDADLNGFANSGAETVRGLPKALDLLGLAEDYGGAVIPRIETLAPAIPHTGISPYPVFRK